MDVSADLTELGRTPVTVVCAGAKSILDIPRTLEFLETQVILPGAGQCWGLPEHSWGIKGCSMWCLGGHVVSWIFIVRGQLYKLKITYQDCADHAHSEKTTYMMAQQLQGVLVVQGCVQISQVS